jgi:signal transduction histidine kinase
LTINLQVASRKSKLAGNDEVMAQVDQCHAIAKLLLSDVREAVSDIRENAAIDFNGALQSLISDLPRPQVQLDIQPDFILSNVKIADALLRIIQEGLTNVIRHTQSHRFNIALSKHDNVYILVMQDVQLNVEKPITQGNGLIGMRERVSALGGELQTGFNAQGFCIRATLVEAE